MEYIKSFQPQYYTVVFEDPVEYKDSALARGAALKIIRGSICVLSRGKRLDIKIYVV